MSKVSSSMNIPRKSTNGAGIPGYWRRLPLLAQMGIIAVGVHLVVFTIFSVGGYLPHEKTPDELYEKGVAAMSAGNYAEARDLFQKVLDQQPKPLPVFARAAEQHRNAERLATQSETAGNSAAPVEPVAPSPAPAFPDATKVIARPADDTTIAQPKPPIPPKAKGGTGTPVSPDQIIPPELR